MIVVAIGCGWGVIVRMSIVILRRGALGRARRHLHARHGLNGQQEQTARANRRTRKGRDMRNSMDGPLGGKRMRRQRGGFNAASTKLSFRERRQLASRIALHNMLIREALWAAVARQS